MALYSVVIHEAPSGCDKHASQLWSIMIDACALIFFIAARSIVMGLISMVLRTRLYIHMYLNLQSLQCGYAFVPEH